MKEFDSKKYIIIKGARENNLQNINLAVPKEKFVIFTGLSGSGKTTLAFDTIYAEGQRRYIESLSSYARQFLGNFEKPDVESIEGLSPAIAIDQKTTSHNPRSTVGTVTEIYDYLRLLYSRIGVPYCPNHNIPITAVTVTDIVDGIAAMEEGTRVQILAPIAKQEKGTYKETLKKIKDAGFERVRVDQEFMRIDEVPELEKNVRHSIDIVIDRLVIKPDIRSRVFDSVEQAFDWGKGLLIIHTAKKEELLSDYQACPICGYTIGPLEPRLFSFNTPMGYCPDCRGLGIKKEAHPDLLVPNKNLSIDGGAIEYYKHTVNGTNLDWKEFKLLLDYYQIPTTVPFSKLTKEQVDIIFNGSKEPLKYKLVSVSGNTLHRHGYIEGVKRKVERLYEETTSDFMREYYAKFLRDHVCTTCKGARLNEKVLNVLIDGKSIYDVTCLTTQELVEWIDKISNSVSQKEKDIVNLVLKEIHNRARFLCNVGLTYLDLSRMALTLSGGESQRIRLATQIGSRLSGVLYVLDEPSIGLHQRDNDLLIKTLKEMRDLGNSLIVVEHDEETMRAADWIVDIGPGAGKEGGQIVASGPYEEVIKSNESITAQYLTGKKFIPLPILRQKGNGSFIEIIGATVNNLKNLDVKIPLGVLNVVTGVSGSGKSSLINQTLIPAILEQLRKEQQFGGKYDNIIGLENIDKIVNVTQEPIGRTPRSNPATYIKLFDEIRDLFAENPESKMRGFDKGRFSFNNKGGRCEKCQGAGVMRISMNFLPDVYVKCDQCEGRRYNEETLQVKYKNKNIFDVLELTVDDALKFFDARPKIARKLQILHDVGLGYIKLGQPATTISGGEAQRVKLANELQRRPTGKTLYVLDEPTTGLHSDDVKRLIEILQNIVNAGDTVIVIEHNLDMIKVADHIIDIGPEGGSGGGEIVASGTPEEIIKVKRSYTGRFLKQTLREYKKKHAIPRYLEKVNLDEDE